VAMGRERIKLGELYYGVALSEEQDASASTAPDANAASSG